MQEYIDKLVEFINYVVDTIKNLVASLQGKDAE